MSDDLVKQAREWREDGPPQEPFYATGHLIDAMADRIEELEAKLAQQDALVQAAVAAALIEAAEDVRQWGSLYSGSEDVTNEAANDILALITEDAQAALDRALAAERERCAEQAESHKPSKSLLSERYWRGVDEAAHSIAVAIRKGGE